MTPVAESEEVTRKVAVHADRRQAGQHAKMAGDAQPARVRPPLPVHQQQIGLSVEAHQRLQHGRQFAKRQQPRHVGELDRPLGERMFDGLKPGERQHGHRRPGDVAAPGKPHIDAGHPAHVASVVDLQHAAGQFPLHGDRFPDVVSRTGGVQFSRAAGGLEGGRRGGPVSPRRSENQSVGASSDLAGNIAVADWGNDRIQVLSPDGAALAVLTGHGDRYSKVTQTFMEARDDLVKLRDEAGGSHPLEPYFWAPTGVTFDAAGTLYAADTLRHRIQVYRRREVN